MSCGWEAVPAYADPTLTGGSGSQQTRCWSMRFLPSASSDAAQCLRSARAALTSGRRHTHAGRPTEALVRIAPLYAIEADIRGRSAEERRQVRQQRTKPLIDALRLWLEAQLATVSGKSTIAGAIRYVLSRWEGLTRFLVDGRIEIDSNVVERSIRPIAMTESFCTPYSSIWKH